MIAKYFLVTNRTEDGRFLAVMTEGHPRKAKNVTVLTLETFEGTDAEAQAAADGWFQRMLVERPWEPRQ